jgi:hypothetical protein
MNVKDNSFAIDIHCWFWGEKGPFQLSTNCFLLYTCCFLFLPFSPLQASFTRIGQAAAAA